SSFPWAIRTGTTRDRSGRCGQPARRLDASARDPFLVSFIALFPVHGEGSRQARSRLCIPRLLKYFS
ncbi:hypothetical protein PENTCL1PPCAC_25988, partial [Pristionchus entomophagus]